MSFHYGNDLGAVDAESESFVPDAGADLSSSFDPAQLLFSGQQSSAPAPQHSNISSPLVQLSLSDLKQVYLEALQTYHQQVLLQAASQMNSASFIQPQTSSGGLNLALLQLQVLAQQQQLQQQHQQQQQQHHAAAMAFGGHQAPQTPMSIPTQATNIFASNQYPATPISSSPTQSVFAVPRPVSEDQRAAREARIQKYRAKRLKRKNARPATSTEKSKALRLRDVNGQFVSRQDHGFYQPHVRELENKLAHTESECEKLRQSLSTKESELAKIKHMLDEQIHRNRDQLSKLQHLMLDPSISQSAARPQYEEHAMQLAMEQRNLQFQQAQVAVAQAQVKEALNSDQMQVDSYASPHSMSSSSPRSGIATPISPATPMAMSTPSAADDDDMMDTTGSSNDSSSTAILIDDDDLSIDDASTRAKLLLAEKLKKLGGPPSDVYYPYWPGFIMHPAFMQKEDWTNMTLRPTGLDPDVLEQERQRYFEAQRRWQQEQEEIAALLTEHPELLNNSAFAGALNWRGGYWAGNWVPAAEKIDFAKIELRKTPSDQLVGMHRPPRSTTEAANQLQQALARRAALEAAAMSAVSNAHQAVSSSAHSARSAPQHMQHRAQPLSAASPSPRSPAMPSPMPASPQTPTSLSSPVKPRLPNSPAHPQAPRGSSSPMRAQASPATLIWREFLRSHGGGVQSQQQMQQNHGTAPST